MTTDPPAAPQPGHSAPPRRDTPSPDAPGGDPPDRATPGQRLDAALNAELATLRAGCAQRSLHDAAATGKWVRRDGQQLLNLAGNDYLGLAQHPAVTAAAVEAIQRFGVGSGASRLVTGTHPAHTRLEQRFAAFKHAPAALLFPTGYTANLAVLTTLARPGDTILQDKLNHASLLDAARFSGAAVRTFPHRGYEKLETLLTRLRPGGRNDTDRQHAVHDRRNASSNRAAPPHPARAPNTTPPRVFIVTDSVFSMDGDLADLPRLVALAQRHDAILVVDEAHATGVLGDTGAGLAEMQGVAGQIDLTMSTASKALGSLGGIVTGSRAVIDTLINRARPLIYTTAGPASQPAAIAAALDIVQHEPHRRARLRDLSQTVRAGLRERGWSVTEDPTPIIPLVTGDNAAALALAKRLRDAGVLGVAIRPPTVPPGAARVRLSLRADLDDADTTALFAAVGSPDGQ